MSLVSNRPLDGEVYEPTKTEHVGMGRRNNAMLTVSGLSKAPVLAPTDRVPKRGRVGKGNHLETCRLHEIVDCGLG